MALALMCLTTLPAANTLASCSLNGATLLIVALELVNQNSDCKGFIMVLLQYVTIYVCMEIEAGAVTNPATSLQMDRPQGSGTFVGLASFASTTTASEAAAWQNQMAKSHWEKTNTAAH